MRKITIEGKIIGSKNSFYDFIEPFLKEGNCPWGRNLDSLNEIVLENFNYTEDASKNIVEIIWNNSQDSKISMGNDFEKIITILESNPSLKLILN